MHIRACLAGVDKPQRLGYNSLHMINTLAQLRTAVAVIGATVDEESMKCAAVVIDAPPCTFWVATRSHSVREDFADRPMSNAIEDAAKVLADGVEDCRDADCDRCAND